MSDFLEYDLIVAKSPDHFTAGRGLFKEYAESLDFDLCFQNFDQELNEIDIQYDSPAGGLILVRHAGDFIGCAGIRKFENRIAELKRMYIRPGYRGLGLGKILLEKSIALAKEKGYERVRLDTLQSMVSASQLYRKLGFYAIEPYRFNPSEDVLYFEKQIQ